MLYTVGFSSLNDKYYLKLIIYIIVFANSCPNILIIHRMVCNMKWKTYRAKCLGLMKFEITVVYFTDNHIATVLYAPKQIDTVCLRVRIIRLIYSRTHRSSHPNSKARELGKTSLLLKLMLMLILRYVSCFVVGWLLTKSHMASVFISVSQGHTCSEKRTLVFGAKRVFFDSLVFFCGQCDSGTAVFFC